MVDDEPDMLGLYKACLGAHGYRVTAASDGAAGLDLAVVDPPVIIILDMLMPGMDGLGFLERLRNDSRTEDIPVLMVSGRDDVDDRVRCLKKGVDDFITKPFEYEELVARVEAITRRAARKSQTQSVKLGPDERRRLQILRNALRDGPDSLVPLYDVHAASGYTYPATCALPDAGDVTDPIADLDFMHAHGYLERTFHDVVLSCPFCSHHNIHLREVCPACGSADLRPVEMIHHYRCAFVGPSEAFRSGEKLVCPKCRVQLRHIGLEYEKPTDTVQCSSCDRGFQEPDVAARCRNCQRPFPPEQAERRRIHSYALTAAGRFVAEVGSFMASPGGPDFTENETAVYRPEFFRELVGHEVARGSSLGHSTALLRIGLRGLEKLVESRGQAAGRRALHQVVRNIRAVIRKVDKIGRIRAADFVVLLPGADTRAAVSLARRVAESFSQSEDEHLERIALSYAWAVHPQEAEDAPALLNRVMEETTTAYLGDPAAYEPDGEDETAGAWPARDGDDNDDNDDNDGTRDRDDNEDPGHGGRDGSGSPDGEAADPDLPGSTEDEEDHQLDQEFDTLINPLPDADLTIPEPEAVYMDPGDAVIARCVGDACSGAPARGCAPAPAPDHARHAVRGPPGSPGRLVPFGRKGG